MEKISETEWEIPKKGKMQVPVRIFASDKLIELIKQDETIKQATNVASLPGLINKVILCPDTHMGYGMPIGGVAAFNLEKGVISPGMVGFDINCGVRLLATNITKKDFMKKRAKVLHDMKRTIPAGVGIGNSKEEKISNETIAEVLTKGSEWAIENNFGEKEDLERCEEGGKMLNANPQDVGQRALARGMSQLGTLGAGNHFIDIQTIDEIYNQETAKIFGLKKDNIAIMIHCGSRGLGHQIASDYMKKTEEECKDKNLSDKELSYVPINSETGKEYLSAMTCAVNFAFCNRQIIMHKIRELLKRHFPKLKSNLVYDVAHNIAKTEEHITNEKTNKKEDVLIVRKGATRSFGPNKKELPKIFKKTGQPVIIPGSMSTPSFVLAGINDSDPVSFSSSAHGAGRSHSRSWTHKTLNQEQVKKILEEKDILLEGSFKGTIEESELAYKDIEEVISVTEKANLSKKVAKLSPIGVVIG
jgi:tRNA-splicing ligase RtcB (3'-phosphate/5'-hydroxy nucleic acid ligase)